MKQRYHIVYCLVCVVTLLCAAAGHAQVPDTMNYQGSLTGLDDIPVDGAIDMQFSLYDSLTDGTLLWSETQTVIVSDGIYSVILGSAMALTGLDFTAPYYLEVATWDAGTSSYEALTPRQPLTSVPYAFRTKSFEGITVQNGNVGIGTTDPQAQLDVNGGLRVSSGNITHGENSSNFGIYQNTNTADSRAWMLFRDDTHANAPGQLCLGGSSISFFYNSTDNPTNGWGNTGMLLTADGDLRIVGAEQTSLFNYGENQDTYIRAGKSTGRVIMDQGSGVYLMGSEIGSVFNYGDNDDTYIRPGKSTGRVIMDFGNVGIGTGNPTFKLDVSGNARITGKVYYGGLVANSDLRLKKDIQPVDKALERVMQLRGVSFQWKDASRGEGRQIGVIAQEVEQVFPELVTTDGEGYKSVAYDKLVAPLIEAVKELKAENDALKAENARMRDEFEQRLSALEALITQK